MQHLRPGGETYLSAATCRSAIAQYDTATARATHRGVGLSGDADEAERYAIGNRFRHDDVVPLRAVVPRTL